MMWLNSLVREHCVGGNDIPQSQIQLPGGGQGQGQGQAGGQALALVPAPAAQNSFRQPSSAATSAQGGGVNNSRQIVLVGSYGGAGVSRFLDNRNFNNNNNNNRNVGRNHVNLNRNNYNGQPRQFRLIPQSNSQRQPAPTNMAHHPNQNQGTGLAVNNRNPPPPVQNPPPAPPIENLKMVELPFYDVERALNPVFLAPSSLSQPAQRKSFDLLLTSWEREIFQNENLTVATQDKGQRPGQDYHLVLRFCCIAQEVPQQKDKFPTNIKLYVNGLQVQLPEAVPSVVSRQVKLITPPAPVEVTRNLSFAPEHHVNPRHTVSVHWAREDYIPDQNQMYYVFPFIVRKSTATFLTEKLRLESSLSRDTTCDLIRSILGANGGHTDICAPESLKVSLNCPIGKIRMTKPCRSTKCRHVQCFDALNFLQMYEKVGIPKMMCPVCNIPVKVQDLRLDEYFLDILSCLSIMDTGSDIEIFQNCLWKSAEIPKKKNYDRKTIDIELIDDSDDEEKAKAKPAEELALVASIKEPVRWAIRRPLPLKQARGPGNSNNSSNVWPVFRRGSITLSDRNSSASSTPNTGTSRPQVIALPPPPSRPSASVSSPEIVDLCDSILEDNDEPSAAEAPPPPSRPSQPPPQKRPTQKPGFVPLVINAPNLLSAFGGSRPPRLNFTRPSPPNPVPLGHAAPVRASAPVIVTLEEDVTDHRATPVGVDIHLQETLPIIDASPSLPVPAPAPTTTSSSVMPPQSAQTLAHGSNVAVEAGTVDGGTGVPKAKKARKEPKIKNKVNDKEAAAAAKPAAEKKSKPKQKKRAQKEKDDSDDDSPPPPEFQVPQEEHQGPVRRSGRNVNKRVNYGKFFESISE